MTLPYVYRWDRQGRKGQPCAVTARGTMNSCRVEFADGYAMITSRNAIMRNRGTDMTKKETAPAPAPVAAVTPAGKIIAGYAIGITAFIPVKSDDLEKQVEISALLLKIHKGEATVADLAPHLTGTEFRNQHVRKRVTQEEYAALTAGPAEVEAEEPTPDDVVEAIAAE